MQQRILVKGEVPKCQSHQKHRSGLQTDTLNLDAAQQISGYGNRKNPQDRGIQCGYENG